MKWLVNKAPPLDCRRRRPRHPAAMAVPSWESHRWGHASVGWGKTWANRMDDHWMTETLQVSEATVSRWILDTTWYKSIRYEMRQDDVSDASAHVSVAHRSPPISGARRLAGHPNAWVGAWPNDLLTGAGRTRCAGLFSTPHTVGWTEWPSWMGGPLDHIQAKHSDVGSGWLQLLEEHSNAQHWWVWLNFHEFSVI